MSQGGNGDPGLRASDADRERIVEQLRQHTADGRLTMEEFDQRMSAAYAAKTYGDLAVLTRDLPVDLGAKGSGTGAGQKGSAAWGAPEDAVPLGGWTAAGSPSPPRPEGPAGEIAAAVLGAAMQWKMQRHAMREQVRAQMREQRRQARMARRKPFSAGAAFSSWAAISVFLTGIWFVTGLAGGGFSDFWPIWPIGVFGLLIVSRFISEAGRRR
jgi:hypothetical protein